MFRNTIMDSVEVRSARGRTFEEMDGTPGSPDSALWARVPGHLSPSAATLAIFGDYVSGAVSQPIGRRAMGRSLDNTLRMVQLKPTEWILCDIRMHALVGGYGQGIAFLWSEDGDLLATASQSIAVRLWPEDRALPSQHRGATNRRTAKVSRNCPSWPATLLTTGKRRRPSGRITAAAVAVVMALLAAAAAFLVLETSATSTATGRHLTALPTPVKATTTTASTVPPTTTTTTRPAGPGFNAGQVTAVGDSVMLDYRDPLKTSIPGINVDASVSRQWSEGESILQTLKAEGQLGGDVVVALGTNGPITDTDFDNMMSILGGASRVVFVNVHVDRPWQDPNNAVLANGATRYPNVVVVDWATLAGQNPQWFGADGTHLAIDGPGAHALASLIASALSNG